MNLPHARTLFASVCLALFVAAAASAQCELGWVNDFGGAETLPYPRQRTIIDTMAAFDPDGAGLLSQRLIVGGDFTHMGGVAARGIAQWDGQAWSALGGGLFPRNDELRVVDLLVHDDDGEGPLNPALYVATLGARLNADEKNGHPVFRWDGTAFTKVGDTEGGPFISLVFYDSGDGERLYGAGAGASLARLEDGAWRRVWLGAFVFFNVNKLIPAQVNGVSVLGAFGSNLYVESDTPAFLNSLAWDGSLGPEEFMPGALLMGFGLTGGVAHDAVYFDEDGDGPLPSSLYVVGRFTTAANQPNGSDAFPARHFARWDGTRWHSLGAEPDRQFFYRGITAITVFDDGTGPALHAGGYINTPPQPLIHGVGKWTGTAWSRVGTNFGMWGFRAGTPDFIFDTASRIRDFQVFPDSEGNPTLLVAGGFDHAHGQPAKFIARLARPFVRGDADGDGVVGFFDVMNVLDRWLARYQWENTGPGDADESGKVGFPDIIEVLRRWGNSCP